VGGRRGVAGGHQRRFLADLAKWSDGDCDPFREIGCLRGGSLLLANTKTIRTLSTRRIFGCNGARPRRILHTIARSTPAALANADWLPIRSTSERSS
jgi:hypothetical protein